MLFRDEQAIDGVGRVDPGTRRAVCAIGELLPMSEGSGEQVLTVSSNAAGDYGLYVRGSFRGVSVRAQPTDAVSVR